MTQQRRIILEALECLGCHPTAEELYATVQQRDASVNLSTIYRTLRWLEQEGLVSARRFDEGRCQERFDPASPSQHYHFLCTRCKEVIEFDSPVLNAVKSQFEARSGSRVESISVTLYGLCKRCRKEG